MANIELSVQAFDRICRVCLNESANMKSLFTKLDGQQELFDVLVFIVNVQVNREDALPKQVCEDCESFMHQADAFKKRYINSETVLKQVYQISNQSFAKPDIKDENELKLIKTSEIDKPDLITLFSNSDISFRKIKSDDKFEVKEEIDVKPESNDYLSNFAEDDGEELVTIPIEYNEENDYHRCACGEVFQNKNGLKQHVKLKQCKIKFKKRNKRTKKETLHKTYIPIKNELTCPYCDLTFDVVSDWTAHQETHDVVEPPKEEDKQYQCSLCLRLYKSKKTLKLHIQKHEFSVEKYTCGKCKREFKYKAYLESHMLSVHVNADGYVCEYCTEKFTSRKSLEVHVDSHKNKKNACPFCDKSFLMLCTLKDHLRTHTGEKPFLCSVCGKGFSQKTNLAQHMRRHMGVKPFTCDICAKGFVSKGELDAHNRKHSGAHPFICDDCGNGFTTSSALLKHRRTHTGERPYACDLCPMKFAATGTLKNHRRTHTGERPYQCSHCEKSFVQRSDLISHIRCHTGERPFICQQCGQAFRKAAAMKAHVKMHARETQNVMTLPGGLILSTMQIDGHMNTV